MINLLISLLDGRMIRFGIKLPVRKRQRRRKSKRRKLRAA